MLAIILIIVGILLRFAPHASNFTPVAAIALFAGVYLNKKYALLIPLALMVASDIFIGLHNVVAFTWGGFVLTALLGMWVRKHKAPVAIAASAVVSSLLFYFVSNFGVWVMGWYPPTLQGLIQCYIAGLPFLRTFTMATLVYTVAFFGIFEIIAYYARNTRLAKVLL